MSRLLQSRISLPDIARRLTGFSTPFFGLNWTPPLAERDTVRSFLTYLEDRRVLFQLYQLEVECDVVQSVQKIRHRCTESLVALPDQSAAIGPVRAIRAACRRFLDEPRANFQNLAGHFRDYGESAGFFTAVGELRAAVGAQIALLAVGYKIEVEAEIASIMPAEDKDDSGSEL